MSRRASVAGLALAASLMARRSESATARDLSPGTTAAASTGPFALAEDYGVSATRPAAENARNLQRAINDRAVVLLPGGADAIEISEPIVLPSGAQVIGAGMSRSIIRASGPQAFLFQAPNGTEMIEGPKLADFTIQTAHVGLKLNSEARGFSDDASTQSYIVRPRLERMRLAGPGAEVAGSAGIDWNLVFSGVIDQCEIVGFDIGLKTLGCDFTAVTNRTRIWNCGTLIQCERSGYFGSGMLIDGADLLVPARCFIRSSDYHLIIRGCFFERQEQQRPGMLSGSVLDISLSQIVLIHDNRFGTPLTDCPRFLKIEGDGVLFVFENNSYGGRNWGTVAWNGGKGARYVFNQLHRQKIFVRGNSAEIEVPFSTVEPDQSRNERRDLWLLSPSTGGFLNHYNYNGDCLVQDGAFVLPALRRYGSLVRFKDGGRPVSGPINIFVLARSDVTGTTLHVNAVSGEKIQAQVPVGLGAEFEWHAPFKALASDDLAIDFFNADVERGGRAYIKCIVVERA